MRHEEQDENKARAPSEAFAKTARYRRFVNSAFFFVPYCITQSLFVDNPR
jgi:hypothetical protein